MATRERVSVDLDAEVAAILRKHAAEAHVSEGQILDRAVRAYDLRALLARLQAKSDLDDDQAIDFSPLQSLKLTAKSPAQSKAANVS